MEIVFKIFFRPILLLLHSTGTLMAVLSFILDQIIKTLIKSRITLFKSKQLGNDYLIMRYFLWTMPSILLILFASGFVHLVSPQAVSILWLLPLKL